MLSASGSSQAERSTQILCVKDREAEVSREEAKRSTPELAKSSGLNLPEPFQTSQGVLKPGPAPCLPC